MLSTWSRSPATASRQSPAPRFRSGRGSGRCGAVLPPDLLTHEGNHIDRYDKACESRRHLALAAADRLDSWNKAISITTLAVTAPGGAIANSGSVKGHSNRRIY